MKVVKYDPITKTYGEPVEIDYPLLCDDMNQLAQCPRCLKYNTYGHMINCGNYFTTNHIWRIAVCPKCASRIWDEELKEKIKK